jgi:UDP-N-acetyl-D-mannosaminuronate dehydrogenase
MNNECIKLYQERQNKRAEEHKIKNNRFREMNLSFHKELRQLEKRS